MVSCPVSKVANTSILPDRAIGSDVNHSLLHQLHDNLIPTDLYEIKVAGK